MNNSNKRKTPIDSYIKDRWISISVATALFVVSIFMVINILYYNGLIGSYVYFLRCSEDSAIAGLFFFQMYIISRFLDYYNENKNRPLRLKTNAKVELMGSFNYCGELSLASFPRDNNFKYDLFDSNFNSSYWYTSSANIYFFCLIGMPIFPSCALCEGFPRKIRHITHGDEYEHSIYGMDKLYFTEVLQVYFTYWGLVGSVISLIVMFF